MTKPTIHRRRPAETAAGGVGLGALIVAIASGDTLAAVIALVGAIPAIVTYLNDNGGLRGILRGIVGAREEGYSPVDVLLIVFLCLVILAVVGSIHIH